MSGKYKFHNPEGIYFVSIAVVYWIDVFVREEYFKVVTESLEYCQKEKGMKLYSWVIMPSHLHLIFSVTNNNPGDVIRDFKRHTSKALVKEITDNPQESRKDWLLWMFKRAGEKNSNITNYQFWQQDNHPIELWSREVIEQKIYYIHHNPVEAGFVSVPEDWKYSSAALDIILDLD